MAGYLTPDTLPADTTCRVLFIPNNEEFIANVTGALQLLTFPENWTQYGTLTPEESADALVDMFDKFCFNVRGCKMIGEIILWSGSSPPDDDNLLLCDGSHISNVDYPALWSIIGTTYGGSGATDFALPDLQGKVAIGASVDHGLASTGGSDTVTLTTAEMPAHTHTTQPHSHSEGIAAPSLAEIPVIPVPSSTPAVGITGASGVTVDSTGGGGAHENMQPFLALNYYIQAA